MATERVRRPAIGTRLSAASKSFAVYLRAGKKSPRTITSYLDAIRVLGAWLEDQGRPDDVVQAITRADLRAFMADQNDRYKATTALARYRSLSVFFRWLADPKGEREIAENPLAGVPRPRVPDDAPDMLSAKETAALLAALERGPGRKSGDAKTLAEQRFLQRRDLAIVRLFLNTGLRLAELAELRLEDLDLDNGLVFVIRKGRGDAKRIAVPFGDKTALALDRYLRSRERSHRDGGPDTARLPWLWIGRRGRFTANGIADMVERKGLEAGIGRHLHPHMFRHTWADDRKSKGVSDGDLMELGGWRTREMLDRYGKAGSARRAIAAAKGVEEI